MKKKWIIPIVIVLSLIFNIGIALSAQSINHTSWLFTDLGPAVMQDSFYVRSPGLESPYGIVGDIPGGYPIYVGNPLQSNSPDNLTSSSNIVDWDYSGSTPEMGTVLLAIVFAIVPITLILILGRRSYGSTKTQ